MRWTTSFEIYIFLNFTNYASNKYWVSTYYDPLKRSLLTEQIIELCVQFITKDQSTIHKRDYFTESSLETN